jgi:uncharacterized protein
MMKTEQSRNTFLIPINKDFIIYAPLVGLSALTNKMGALELQNQLKLIPNNQGNQNSKLYTLAKDILNSPVEEPNRRTGKINPEFLGIIPTRSCNGACNYCDFGADKASSDKMTYQLASKAVDWYVNLRKENKRNDLEIHFFGGEPMIARDVIEVVVHRARLLAAQQNLIPSFEISTNGQYNQSDARFLGQYFNNVILSLDGFQEFQEKHRPLKSNKNSFKNATQTAKIISDSNAELSIRCCVSQLNVSKIEDITEWLCRSYRLSAINFEILCSTPQTDSLGLFPPDPVEFAIHFQHSREIAKGYGIKIVYASDISHQPMVSSCPVGKDTAIVSPDGRISNCYLMPEKWQNVGIDLDFGIIQANGEAHIDVEKVTSIRNMVENKPRCANCFCQWSCAGGCHVGTTFPASNLAYDNFCKQTRLISTFSLLSDLGVKDKIEELIKTPKALQNIVNQASDNIQAFKN